MSPPVKSLRVINLFSVLSTIVISTAAQSKLNAIDLESKGDLVFAHVVC